MISWWISSEYLSSSYLAMYCTIALICMYSRMHPIRHTEPSAYTVDSITKRSNLLISKARVAPCKEGRLTIPKLELTASLIGARLIRYLSNIHQFKTIYLWSDSKVVISWITGDRELKDVYVANRVAEVKTILTRHSIQVKYVPTKDNPADYLSRGCSSKQLKSSNWLHGPSWLLTCEFPEQTNLEVVVN